VKGVTDSYAPKRLVRVWTEEQRRPAASGHSDHPRPSGPDGGSAESWTDLRGGRVIATARVSTRVGCQDGSAKGVIARIAVRKVGSGRRRFTRLLIFDFAFSLDAEPGPSHFGRTDIALAQALADDTGRGTHQRPTGPDSRTATKDAWDAQVGVISLVLANCYFRRSFTATSKRESNTG
jgi:hypothetical protein